MQSGISRWYVLVILNYCYRYTNQCCHYISCMHTVATEYSLRETRTTGVARFRSQLMHHTITMVTGHNSHTEVSAYPRYLTGRFIVWHLYILNQYITEIWGTTCNLVQITRRCFLYNKREFHCQSFSYISAFVAFTVITQCCRNAQLTLKSPN